MHGSPASHPTCSPSVRCSPPFRTPSACCFHPSRIPNPRCSFSVNLPCMGSNLPLCSWCTELPHPLCPPGHGSPTPAHHRGSHTGDIPISPYPHPKCQWLHSQGVLWLQYSSELSLTSEQPHKLSTPPAHGPHSLSPFPLVSSCPHCHLLLSPVWGLLTLTMSNTPRELRSHPQPHVPRCSVTSHHLPDPFPVPHSPSRSEESSPGAAPRSHSHRQCHDITDTLAHLGTPQPCDSASLLGQHL